MFSLDTSCTGRRLAPYSRATAFLQCNATFLRLTFLQSLPIARMPLAAWAHKFQPDSIPQIECHLRFDEWAQRHAHPSVDVAPKIRHCFKASWPIVPIPAAARLGSRKRILEKPSCAWAAISALFEPPTDGKDPKRAESLTYPYSLHSFDHDITFDPASSLQMQDALRLTFPNPAFDLDNVYGRGPDGPAVYV